MLGAVLTCKVDVVKLVDFWVKFGWFGGHGHFRIVVELQSLQFGEVMNRLR